MTRKRRWHTTRESRPVILASSSLDQSREAKAVTTLRHTTRLCKPCSTLCKKLIATNENDVSKSAASIDRQRQCCQHKSRTFRYFHEQQRPVRLDKDVFSPSKQCRHATGGDDKLNFVSHPFTNVCRNVITCRRF